MKLCKVISGFEKVNRKKTSSLSPYNQGLFSEIKEWEIQTDIGKCFFMSHAMSVSSRVQSSH